MKKQIIGITLLSVAMFAGSVFAMPGMDFMGHSSKGGKCLERGGMPGHPDMMMVEALNLSKAQQADMKKLMLEEKLKANTRMAEYKNLNLKLWDELANDSPDRGKIEKLVTEINKLQGASLNAMIDHILAVRKLLTPEQVAKLQTLQKSRMKQCNGENCDRDMKRPGAHKPDNK